MTPELFLYRFYATYLGLLDQRAPRLAPSETLERIKPGLAPQFLDEILALGDDVGADPLLDAQDYESGWQFRIQVQFKSRKPECELYTVCFGGPGEMRHAVEVTLVKPGEEAAVRAVRRVSPAICRHASGA